MLAKNGQPGIFWSFLLFGVGSSKWHWKEQNPFMIAGWFCQAGSVSEGPSEFLTETNPPPPVPSKGTKNESRPDQLNWPESQSFELIQGGGLGIEDKRCSKPNR